MAKPTPESPSPALAARLPAWGYALAAAALAAGLGGRAWLTSLAPRWAYPWDHLDNIQMGRAASEHGLFGVYSLPVERIPAVAGYVYDANGVIHPFTRQAVRKVNYPPLGVALFWVQSALLRVIDPGPVNTVTSRAVMSLASVLAELAAAAGVFLVVRRLAGPKPALLAGAVTWLMPPLAMDSCFWGQTDGWFLAPAVFTVWLMLRGRWAGAGICAAVAALLKPQGIFLGPVVLAGAWLLSPGPKGTDWLRAGKRAGRLIAAGAAGLVLLSLPWTIAGGAEWIREGYVANFGKYPETTLKAFNVWYLDVLRLDGQPLFALDSRARLMGIAKDSLGRLGVLAALAAAVWLIARRQRRRGPQALVLFAALWIWSTFIWPTQVHERYIVLCIPLVVAAAGVWRRLWPAVAALAIVGAAELCHNVWLNLPPGTLVNRLSVPAAYQDLLEQQQRYGGPRPTLYDAEQLLIHQGSRLRESYLQLRRRTVGWEYALVLLSLGAYGWAFIAPFALREEPAPQPSVPGRAKRTPPRR